MKPLTFFIVLLTLLVIPYSVAEIQSLGTAKQGDCVQIVQTYSNSTYTNMTKIMFPDKGIIYYGLLLEKHNSDYNLTYCNTQMIGEYQPTLCTDVDGIDTCVVYNFFITPTGTDLEMVHISVYIFFLLICLVVSFFSFRLINNNKMKDDKITGQQLYEMKKEKELSYYVAILKRKMWIVGVFGIYLSTLLFIAMLSQLVYDLGLSSLNEILKNGVLLMSWGLIPFALFWCGYIIVYFMKSTTEIMEYELGGFRK